MRLIRKILIILVLLAAYRLQAQQLTSAHLVELRKAYVEALPWEELYLHIDREKLIAGEDLWFSIYSSDRLTGKLSYRSSVAYIELINPWNVPIIQKRFLLEGGRGEGGFQLPDTLSSGSYVVRAYTRWMRNFLPENCHTQVINVFNPFRNKGFKRMAELSDSLTKTLDIGFFPEGGVLLNGIENKVIARCVDRYGKGVSLSAVVTDEQGSEVTRFKSDEYGFGTIILNPQKGKSYTVRTNAGIFNLPQAKDNGLSVTVDNSLQGVVDLIISAAGTYVLPSARKYFFIIQTNGNIDFISEIKINDIFTKISVPRIRFPGGVSQISLISEDGNVMFERLVFSQPKLWRTTGFKSDSLFGKREKVTLDLGQLKDVLSGISDMSVSVSPEKAASETGIKEYMLFGTEYGKLPWQDDGKSISGLHPKVIDDFLICSDSRWIDWKKIITSDIKVPEFQPEKDGHFLDVSIKYREPEQVDSVKYLYMAIQGKYAEFKYARRDSTGNYEFILPVDNVLRKLIIQPAVASSNMILEVKPSFIWSLQDSYTITTELTDSLLEEFSGLSFNYQASRIFSSVYKKEKPDGSNIITRKPRFYGIPEIEIIMDDYIKLPVMQEVFFELIPGVSLRSRKTGYEIRIINPFNGMYYEEEPLVMIDGLILSDINILANFDTELVERIEVVQTPYLIGDLILSGIVNVITRTGTYSNVVIPEYAAQIPYRVIDEGPLFAGPDYSDENSRLSRIPDLRNTIYWNPAFRTSESNSNTIEFWTPDLAGNYNIDIEGISSTGEKISITKTITVR